jgi:hypothetical protein
VKKYTKNVRLLHDTPILGVKYDVKKARRTGTAINIKVNRAAMAQSNTDKVALMLSSGKIVSMLGDWRAFLIQRYLLRPLNHIHSVLYLLGYARAKILNTGGCSTGGRPTMASNVHGLLLAKSRDEIIAT